MNTLKRFRIAFIILAVLEVVLGVVLILNPMTSAITLSYLFGALVLIWGLAKVIGYFTKDDFGVPYGLDLAGGILNLLMGLLLIIFPGISVAVLPVFVALTLLFGGILRIQTAVELKRVGYGNWWLTLLFALIVTALSIFLLFNPFAGTVIAMVLIGITIAADGIINLCHLLWLSRR